MGSRSDSKSAHIWKQCRLIFRSLNSVGETIQSQYEHLDATLKDLNRYFEPKFGRKASSFHDLVDVLSLRRTRTAISQIYLQEKDFDRLESILCLYDKLNEIHNQLTSDVIRPVHREYHAFFVTTQHSRMFDDILLIVKDVKACIAKLEEENSPGHKSLPRVAPVSKNPMPPHEKLWNLYNIVQKEMHAVFSLLESVEEWRIRHPENPPDKNRFGHEHCVFPAIDFTNSASHYIDHNPPSTRGTSRSLHTRSRMDYALPISRAGDRNILKSRQLVNRHECKDLPLRSQRQVLHVSEPEMNPLKWQQSLRQPKYRRPTTRLGPGYPLTKGGLVGTYISERNEYGKLLGGSVPMDLWGRDKLEWDMHEFEPSILKISKWNMQEPPQTARRVNPIPPPTRGHNCTHRHNPLDAFDMKPVLSKPRKSAKQPKRITNLFARGIDQDTTTEDSDHSAYYVSKETGRRIIHDNNSSYSQQNSYGGSYAPSTPISNGLVNVRNRDVASQLRGLNEKIASLEHAISQHLIDKEGLRKKIIDPLRWQVQQSFDWLKVLYTDKEKGLGQLQNRLNKLKSQRSQFLAKHPYT